MTAPRSSRDETLEPTTTEPPPDGAPAPEDEPTEGEPTGAGILRKDVETEEGGEA